MKWSEVDLSSIILTEKKNGGSKITQADGTPLRFQIPMARVMYDGLSSFNSVTLEMPHDFVEWWEKLDKELPEPSRSNMKDNGLRLKVDTATQFFNESKKSIFPDLNEGALRGETLICIIDIPGTYYFQDNYGYIVRIHQAVLKTRAPTEVVPESNLKGFSFI
jgi:hypothetical protein